MGYSRSSVRCFSFRRYYQDARFPRRKIEYGYQCVGRFVQPEDRGSSHAVHSAWLAVAGNDGADRLFEIQNTDGSGCNPGNDYETAIIGNSDAGQTINTV